MKLGLGTVAFGMKYGVSNTLAQPAPGEVRQILEAAASGGVRCLDTAAAYGSSESVLGETLAPDHPFEIVTKLPRGTTGATAAASFESSLARLKQRAIHGLMLHDATDLSPELARALVGLKGSGRVRRVGVSVYDAAQIDRALSFDGLDLVQVPLNLLDQRLIESGHLGRLKAAGWEIHARSVFLQGLLLMPAEAVPAALSSVGGHLQGLRAEAAEKGVSMLQLALGFVHGLPEIDRVLVGVASRAELVEILGAMSSLPHVAAATATIARRAAWRDPKVLNPASWGLQ